VQGLDGFGADKMNVVRPWSGFRLGVELAAIVVAGDVGSARRMRLLHIAAGI
jgi:hypothetical protein